MKLSNRLRQLTIVDAAMILLAFISVVLLLYVEFGDVDAETRRRLVIVDVSICVVFALEFLWRWRREGWRRSFFWRNWFEILGMIPVSNAALRSFRLLRLVVVVARLARLTDRAAGRSVSDRILSRLLSPLVEQIKHPITLAVLGEVSEVLRAGQYNHNVARALEENRDELRAMVLEKIKEDRQMGRFSMLPFHDRLIETSTDTSMRVILAVLEDPRTEELISDVLRENILQIRHDVREKGVAGAVRETGSDDSVAALR